MAMKNGGTLDGPAPAIRSECRLEAAGQSERLGFPPTTQSKPDGKARCHPALCPLCQSQSGGSTPLHRFSDHGVSTDSLSCSHLAALCFFLWSSKPPISSRPRNWTTAASSSTRSPAAAIAGWATSSIRATYARFPTAPGGSSCAPAPGRSSSLVRARESRPPRPPAAAASP